jgi:ribonuclease Z
VPVLAELKADAFTIRGMSLGGVYTSLHVPELDCVFDVGIALRSASAVGTLLLSHGHADHVGALMTFLGARALHGNRRPLRVLMPAEIVDDLMAGLAAMTRLQRWPLDVEPIGLSPGDVYWLRKDLAVRAIKTFHPVPSLGYLVARRIDKLRPEFLGLPGPEIARRRAAGEDLCTSTERRELAYLTDTLVQVLDHSPEVLDARVVILEATFLDERKSLDGGAGRVPHPPRRADRAGRRADHPQPGAHARLAALPPRRGRADPRRPPAAGLRARTQAFVPTGPWPG